LGSSIFNFINYQVNPITQLNTTGVLQQEG